MGVYIYMYSMIWYNFRVDFSEKRDGTNQHKFNFPTASVHSSQQCEPLEPKWIKWSPGTLEAAGVKTIVLTLNHKSNKTICIIIYNIIDII